MEEQVVNTTTLVNFDERSFDEIFFDQKTVDEKFFDVRRIVHSTKNHSTNATRPQMMNLLDILFVVQVPSVKKNIQLIYMYTISL